MLNILDLARIFDFVRERRDEQTPQNRGLRVEAIQHWSSGQFGDSWCCEFATMVLDLHFKGKSPISRGGACQDLYEMARLRHWVVTDPQPGDLYLFVTDADHAHHVGFVTDVDPLAGISGNTSQDGTSDNGDGVHEHPLTVPRERIRFVRVPGVAA